MVEGGHCERVSGQLEGPDRTPGLIRMKRSRTHATLSQLPSSTNAPPRLAVAGSAIKRVGSEPKLSWTTLAPGLLRASLLPPTFGSYHIVEPAAEAPQPQPHRPRQAGSSFALPQEYNVDEETSVVSDEDDMNASFWDDDGDSKRSSTEAMKEYVSSVHHVTQARIHSGAQHKYVVQAKEVGPLFRNAKLKTTGSESEGGATQTDYPSTVPRSKRIIKIVQYAAENQSDAVQLMRLGQVNQDVSDGYRSPVTKQPYSPTPSYKNLSIA